MRHPHTLGGPEPESKRVHYIGGIVAAGSGVVGIDPATLTNLVGYYDAEQIDQADNSDIDTWADLSGNGNDFVAFSGNKPKLKKNQINGLAVVSFSGAAGESLILNNYLVDISEYTVIAVVKQGADTSGTQYFHSMYVSAAQSPPDGFQLQMGIVGSDWAIAYIPDQASTTRHDYGPPTDPTAAAIWVMRTAENDRTSLALNGVERPGNTVGVYDNVSASALNKHHLGSGYTGGSQLFKGQIAYLALVERDITDEEASGVADFLMNRYGITGPAAVSATSDVSDLWIDLDADAITGLSNGDDITGWPDSSAKGFDLDSISATAPKWYSAVKNGHAAVRFTGSEHAAFDGLTAPDYLPDEITMFVVAECDDTTSFGIAATVHSPEASGDFQMQVAVNDTTNHPAGSSSFFFNTDFAVANDSRQGPDHTANTFFIAVARGRASNHHTIELDRVEGTSTQLLTDLSVMDGGASGVNGIRIGANPTGASGFWKGDILRVIVYARALTGMEIERVRLFLETLYNL